VLIPLELFMPDLTPPAPIKLIVVDIDGTIAGQSNEVRPAVKEALRKALDRGIKVGVATGRMYQSACRFHHEIGANVPVMAYQGAWIQDPGSDQPLRHLQVDQEIAIELIDYFEQAHLPEDLSIHVYIDDRLYVQAIKHDTSEYTKRSSVVAHPVADLREIMSAAPTKILAMHPDASLISTLLADLKTKYRPDQLHITTSVPIFLETTNPAINKGAAIDYLAKNLLGITAQEVMAIGDNHNDVEMLTYAGWGVAMGNAPPEVKAQANWVAPSVDEDGVAAAIDRFVLSQC
jgi:Cof subfamily protein (haloacid dehalogenase superfamily)